MENLMLSICYLVMISWCHYYIHIVYVYAGLARTGLEDLGFRPKTV